MVSEKMGLLSYRRPVVPSMTLIYCGKTVRSIFMKFAGFVYYVEDYCCANCRNKQSFLTCLKKNSKIAIFANHFIFIYSGR